MHIKRALYYKFPRSVRRFSFLGNRGIWSKRQKNALPGSVRQAARCLSALRGYINLLLSTWSAARSQRILHSYFTNTEHADRNIFHIFARNTI